MILFYNTRHEFGTMAKMSHQYLKIEEISCILRKRLFEIVFQARREVMNGNVGKVLRTILDYPGNREKYRRFANDGTKSSETFTVRLRDGKDREVEVFKGVPPVSRRGR